MKPASGRAERGTGGTLRCVLEHYIYDVVPVQSRALYKLICSVGIHNSRMPSGRSVYLCITSVQREVRTSMS